VKKIEPQRTQRTQRGGKRVEEQSAQKKASAHIHPASVLSVLSVVQSPVKRRNRP
jgi:hypothetical protein